jgi:hypothetical protein
MGCLRGAYAALARRRIHWRTEPDGAVGRHVLSGRPFRPSVYRLGRPFMLHARARLAKIKQGRKSVSRHVPDVRDG